MRGRIVRLGVAPNEIQVVFEGGGAAGFVHNTAATGMIAATVTTGADTALAIAATTAIATSMLVNQFSAVLHAFQASAHIRKAHGRLDDFCKWRGVPNDSQRMGRCMLNETLLNPSHEIGRRIVNQK
jgi:hypothetical protein